MKKASLHRASEAFFDSTLPICIPPTLFCIRFDVYRTRTQGHLSELKHVQRLKSLDPPTP